MHCNTENIKGNNCVIYLKGITKRFPGVLAVENVDFELLPGEVYGLVGKNGAGKSTLMNILSGILQQDSGTIHFEGNLISNLNPRKALKLGIAIMPQEVKIVPDLSVAENLFLAEYPTNKFGNIKWKKMYEQTSEILTKINLSLNPKTKAGLLSIGQQQLLAVAKAFFIKSYKVIIMDETTASMTSDEEELLFKLIKRKIKTGASIIFISHHIQEIFKICSRVTVLKDAVKIGTYETNSLNLDKLNEYIIGHKPKDEVKQFHIPSSVSEDEIFQVKNIYTDTLKNVSFGVKKGEIIGVAGIRGSGRTELFRAIVGLDNIQSGKLYLDGKEVQINSPVDALKKGIMLLPENKEKEGIIAIRSVKENISLSFLNNLLQKYISFTGFINVKKEIYETKKMIDLFNIKTPTIDQEINFLSGGNKQKCLVARLYIKKPRLFLLDELTKGIDVETKQEILNLTVNELTKIGSVMIISSELEDLTSVCNRIIILNNGELVKIIQQEDFLNNPLELQKVITNVKRRIINES